MNLAVKIAEVRKNSGLTQKDFAEKLFVTRQAVTRWENGETTPTIETLKMMIDLFKVDANVLFDSTTVCQSCGWQFSSADDIGANADKSANPDYCSTCFADGKLYAENRSLDEWVEECIQYMDDKSDEAKKAFRELCLKLKRWSK